MAWLRQQSHAQGQSAVREFEVVIMIEGVTEEMHGSD
jgi:hypothetical protein